MKKLLLKSLVATLLTLSNSAIAAPSIVGRWVSPVQGDNASFSVQFELNAQATTFVLIERGVYASPQLAPLAYEKRLYYSYEFSGSAYLLANTYNLDQTVRSHTLILRSQAIVDQFNRVSRCGINNWRLDEEQDVTGMSCEPDNPQPFHAGDKRFNIVSIDGNHLMFGYFPPNDEHIGTDASHRPRDLDRSVIFAKMQ